MDVSVEVSAAFFLGVEAAATNIKIDSVFFCLVGNVSNGNSHHMLPCWSTPTCVRRLQEPVCKLTPHSPCVLLTVVLLICGEEEIPVSTVEHVIQMGADLFASVLQQDTRENIAKH